MNRRAPDQHHGERRRLQPSSLSAPRKWVFVSPDAAPWGSLGNELQGLSARWGLQGRRGLRRHWGGNGSSCLGPPKIPMLRPHLRGDGRRGSLQR